MTSDRGSQAGGAALPPAWVDLLAEMDQRIDAVGYWNGEALRLREAMGWTRLSKARGRQLGAMLAAAGLEIDGSAPRFESEPLLIIRDGSAETAKLIEELLPAIRQADREVPENASWRDAVVARQAVSRWRRRGQGAG